MKVIPGIIQGILTSHHAQKHYILYTGNNILINNLISYYHFMALIKDNPC